LIGTLLLLHGHGTCSYCSKNYKLCTITSINPNPNPHPKTIVGFSNPVTCMFSNLADFKFEVHEIGLIIRNSKYYVN